MQAAGAALAKKYGLDCMKVGEDRQKGIWGEAFTRILEEQDGECTKTIDWTNGVDKYPCVSFDFRFATPRLGMRDATGNVGAFVEVYWPYDSEAKDYDRTKPFEITEVMYWHPERGGLKMHRDLTRLINAILKKQ